MNYTVQQVKGFQDAKGPTPTWGPKESFSTRAEVAAALFKIRSGEQAKGHIYRHGRDYIVPVKTFVAV